MYHLLFRSRWFALLWVVLMCVYAVTMTSGGMLFPVPQDAARRDPEAEKRAKFDAWAGKDTTVRRDSAYSGSGDDGSFDAEAPVDPEPVAP